MICRSGFYDLHHIDPPFADAQAHDPDGMCCLCLSCHGYVTRGHRSNEYVLKAYRKIASQHPSEVEPPKGPLDFHDGTAELLIGGLRYSPAVQTVLRYFGKDLIKVVPGSDGEPGKISAVFTTETGEESLRLEENEWVGSLDAWDTEVKGRRLIVRQKAGRIALQLKLLPPGRIAVERLEMRYQEAYVLASDSAFAVGREVGGNIWWVRADVQMDGDSTAAAAIEFAEPDELEARQQRLVPGTRGRQIIGGGTGFSVNHIGIAIGTQTDGLYVGGIECGAFEYDEVRAAMFTRTGEHDHDSLS